MKVLVSAYACDPYQGSEPGVGWAAVCRIARYHDVWVLTDDSNRAGWERGRREGIIPDNVRVRFLRKNRPFIENRFLAHLQSWCRYSDFNRRVLSAARTWHEEVGFELCHQVSIAAWRMPSPLWMLPIPFVWGPIGGAGQISPRFRSILSFKSRFFELLRDWNTWYSLKSKKFKLCIENTSVVIAANEETELLLRPYRQDRYLLKVHVSSIPESKAKNYARPSTARNEGPLRLFAGGNIEGRKGVSLALRALAVVADKGIDFQYTIAGGGPEFETLKALAFQLGISESVEFHPGFTGKDYLAKLHSTDVYFLPSYRETMGMTLVEAILAGCYPVVADVSAQGEIVRRVGGTAVKADSIDEMVTRLSDSIIWCHGNRGSLPCLANQAAAKAAREFSSDHYDDVICQAYDKAIAAFNKATKSKA